jgi:hypothetical protein
MFLKEKQKKNRKRTLLKKEVQRLRKKTNRVSIFFPFISSDTRRWPIYILRPSVPASARGSRISECSEGEEPKKKTKNLTNKYLSKYGQTKSSWSTLHFVMGGKNTFSLRDSDSDKHKQTNTFLNVLFSLLYVKSFTKKN